MEELAVELGRRLGEARTELLERDTLRVDDVAAVRPARCSAAGVAA